MRHVLIGGPIHEAGLDRLKKSGLTFDIATDLTSTEGLHLLERADAILLRTQPMPATLIDRAGKLKILSRHGVGYDNVDVSALSRRGIPLCVVGDANSVSVAEHTMMLMLALARQIINYDRQTRAGHWRYRDRLYSTDLRGKTLLLLGGGRIGRAVAKRALAFEMQVEIYDPSIAPEQLRALGVEPVHLLANALGRADILSVHIPSQSGGAFIGKAEIESLKPGAIVINTARGGVIDEAELLQALASGQVGAAGLDVFEHEPLSPEHPLLKSEKVILTPHAAGLSQEAAIQMSVMAAQNIVDFFEGCLNPSLIVNKSAVLL